MGPTAKVVLGTLGAMLLIGGGGAALAYGLADVPDRASVAVETGAEPKVVIDDPDDLLSPEDEERLIKDAARLDHPAVVKELHYMIFAHNHENVLDTVENYLRENAPDLLGNAENPDDRIADGVALIGTGMDPRRNFAFYGNDILRELHVDHGQRDEEVLEAMKPGLRDGNIPAGFFAGAKTAFDVEAAEQYVIGNAEDERSSGALLAGLGGAAAAGIGGTGIGAVANRRRRDLEEARSNYRSVTSEYAGLAERLDQIDIRANSLSSGFADAEMRREWAEVRDRFFSYHEAVSGAGGIGDIDVNDNKEVLRNRKKLRQTAESVEHVSNAEDNINRLFDIENGDAAARRAGLTDLREDVMAARVRMSNEELQRSLAQLEERINWLDANPTAPQFLDEFVRVLGDYGLLLDEVRREEFSDVKEYSELRRPAIYDRDYTYPGAITFIAMDSWHADNVRQHEQEQASVSSSSGTRPGVASSGFTAGGSSSSW